MDRRVVKKIDICVEYTFACTFGNVGDHFEWLFVWVNNLNLDGARSFIWDELIGLMSWWILPCYIGGDLNVTRRERLSTASVCPPMIAFSEQKSYWFFCVMLPNAKFVEIILLWAC